jgi:hypothetical protein
MVGICMALLNGMDGKNGLDRLHSEWDQS